MTSAEVLAYEKELEENHASYVVDHPEDILKFI